MLHDQGLMDTSTHNKNIIEQIFPEVLKSIPKGYNITIVYTITDYKLKVMNNEDDTMKISPMI